MKEARTDVALYWTTLRVFANKLSALLSELENDSTWTTVRCVGPFGDDEGVEVRLTKSFSLGFESATNTLAALLKVEPNFNTLTERTITREQIKDAERIVFARDLAALSSELLANFDDRVKQEMRA